MTADDYLRWASNKADDLGLTMSHKGRKQLPNYTNSLFRGVIMFYLNTSFKVSSAKIGQKLDVHKTLGTYWTGRVRDMYLDGDPVVKELLKDLKPQIQIEN